MTPLHGVRRRGGEILMTMTLLVAACGPASTPHVRVEPGKSQPVRVALAARASDLVLRMQGSWEVHCGGQRWTPQPNETLRFVPFANRITVIASSGEERSDAHLVELAPLDSTAIATFAGAPYRGALQVRLDDGGLTCIDRLDLEEYLRGVVPWEIGCRPEVQSAVEAQAIAARTYTCTRLGQFAAQGFDLYADERDQVFKGVQRLDPVADLAIAATRGLVLDEGGRLVQAYYCSTCGGYTSWIEHVWDKPAQPYLTGQRDAPSDGSSFCAASPHFRWTEAWSGAELERTIQETLPRVLQLPQDTAVGALLDLRELDRDVSGRVLQLEVRTTTGTYRVRGDSIRWVLRPRDRRILRSILFRLEVVRDGGAIMRVVARGAGNGHGVGMCQMGAVEMSRQGFDRDAILAHYYRGATLRRAY